MAETIQHIAYRDLILSMNCQKMNGRIIPAKPLVVLAIIDSIENKTASNNKISIEVVRGVYNNLQAEYNVGTPFQYPLYFMESESFYHLKWKGDKIKTKAPSNRMIRDNIEYAYLDNALWDLLQDSETRTNFRDAIINYYLK